MKSWKEITIPFLNSETGKRVKQHIIERRKEVTVYPEQKDVFRAIRDETCTPDRIKLVILGQDPYHNGSADGLAFSCRSQKRPESLKNIFEELHTDLYSYLKKDTFESMMTSNSLEKWASQGVLLLNTVLTVEEGQPNSHKDIGWEELTSQVVERMGAPERTPTVFMLWGKHAQEYKPLIRGAQHLILEAAHPSPLSASKGFFGCRHFSQAERFFKDYLKDDMLSMKPFDMRKYLDLEGLMSGIKEFIISNRIPIQDPRKKLSYIFNDIETDYHWMMRYGIDYLT